MCCETEVVDAPPVPPAPVKKVGPPTVKVVLLGGSAVGKTSLVRRYVENKFAKSHLATIGGAQACKDLILDGVKIKLELWDSAGDAKVENVVSAYLRDAAAVLVVYDVGNTATLEGAKKWLEVSRTRDPIVALVANKCEEQGAAGVEPGKRLAEEMKVTFRQVSAKAETGGVEEMFRDVITQVMIRRRQSET